MDTLFLNTGFFLMLTLTAVILLGLLEAVVFYRVERRLLHQFVPLNKEKRGY